MKILSINENAKLEKANLTVECYKAGEWVVSIYDNDNTYDVYLKHEKYGISDLMFGVFKENTDHNELLEMIEANLFSHSLHYAEEFMEE